LIFHNICSNKILIPIEIRIKPPKISAPFLRIFPNKQPKYTEANDKTKVVIPIIIEGEKISILRRDKEMPTAKASILVAIDKNKS